MINSLTGTVTAASEQSLTLTVSGIGLEVCTPRPELFAVNDEVTICTYLHWHSENGPSLYGFRDELDREIFLHIIDCPKIGPKIGLAILRQMTSAHFVDAVRGQNIKALSSISGVGVKKAEQIVTSLKDKITKLVTSGKISAAAQDGGSIEWANLSDALSSLGYTKQEISTVMANLAKDAPKTASFDMLLRSALSLLTKQN